MAKVVSNAKKVLIEGNIATGKSTFIQILEAENPNWRVILEPLSRWTNVKDAPDISSSQANGGNLLDLFYSDPKRWAYTFESYTLTTRMKDAIRLSKDFKGQKEIQFFERSVFSSRYVFASNSYESDLITDVEWDLYKDYSNFLFSSVSVLRPDAIVYLKADPQISYKRMLKRDRKEESSVSLSYLESLHTKHEEWLNKQSIDVHKSLEGVPILTIDCNEEFIYNDNQKACVLEKLNMFLKKNSILD